MRLSASMVLSASVLIAVAGLLVWRVLGAERQEQRAPSRVSSEKANWKQLKRTTEGFEIRYPPDWVIQYPGDSITLLPKDNPTAFDADLNRDVPSPGIDIKPVGVPDGTDDGVARFVELRPRGYKGYKHIKKYPCNIPGSKYATCYEFQFNAGTVRWTALSLVVQRGRDMFNVTASGRSEDFEKFRKELNDIVLSFALLK